MSLRTVTKQKEERRILELTLLGKKQERSLLWTLLWPTCQITIDGSMWFYLRAVVNDLAEPSSSSGLKYNLACQ